MFCGTSSFAHVDPDDRGGAVSPSSAPSTPRGSRCRSRSKKGRESKNPYSTRGLDTFYAVLAELEARRQRIVEKVGEKGSMVRFEYSDSQWVPIVVRLPTATELADEKKKKKKSDVHQDCNQQQRKNKHEGPRRTSSLSPSRQMSPKSPQPVQSTPTPWTQAKQLEVPAALPTTAATAAAAAAAPPKDKASERGCFRQLARCRTAYVGPPFEGSRSLVVLALILICLAAFGRTFAICCTCAWWYLAPSSTPARMAESGGGRWWVKNKTVDYGRRCSGKSLGSLGFSAAEGSATSPPKQRADSLVSPPKQRQSSGLPSPPKQRVKNFLSPPKSRVVSPAKRRLSFNNRRGSLQLD